MIETPFTMVVFIVLIGVAGGIIISWIEARKEIAKSSDSAETEMLRSEVEALKERVHVLEKLATDDDRDLRDEFRRLA